MGNITIATGNSHAVASSTGYYNVQQSQQHPRTPDARRNVYHPVGVHTYLPSETRSGVQQDRAAVQRAYYANNGYFSVPERKPESEPIVFGRLYENDESSDELSQQDLLRAKARKNYRDRGKRRNRRERRNETSVNLGQMGTRKQQYRAVPVLPSAEPSGSYYSQTFSSSTPAAQPAFSFSKRPLHDQNNNTIRSSTEITNFSEESPLVNTTSYLREQDEDEFWIDEEMPQHTQKAVNRQGMQRPVPKYPTAPRGGVVRFADEQESRTTQHRSPLSVTQLWDSSTPVQSSNGQRKAQQPTSILKSNNSPRHINFQRLEEYQRYDQHGFETFDKVGKHRSPPRPISAMLGHPGEKYIFKESQKTDKLTLYRHAFGTDAEAVLREVGDELSEIDAYSDPTLRMGDEESTVLSTAPNLSFRRDFVETVAAIVIQTTWRRYFATEFVAYLRQLRNEKRKREMLLSSARRQNQAVRSVPIDTENTSANDLNASLESSVEGMADYMFHMAAVRIQAAFRGFLARDTLLVDNFCASIIQKAFRKYHTRDLSTGYSAAVIIQCAVRRFLARLHAADRLGCIIYIQSIVRGHLARCNIDEFSFAMQEKTDRNLDDSLALRNTSSIEDELNEIEEVAAVIIQSRWRAFSAETRFIGTLIDVLIVQSLIRSWLARTRVAQMREVAIETRLAKPTIAHSPSSWYERRKLERKRNVSLPTTKPENSIDVLSQSMEQREEIPSWIKPKAKKWPKVETSTPSIPRGTAKVKDWATPKLQETVSLQLDNMQGSGDLSNATSESTPESVETVEDTTSPKNLLSMWKSKDKQNTLVLGKRQ